MSMVMYIFSLAILSHLIYCIKLYYVFCLLFSLLLHEDLYVSFIRYRETVCLKLETKVLLVVIQNTKCRKKTNVMSITRNYDCKNPMINVDNAPHIVLVIGP